MLFAFAAFAARPAPAGAETLFSRAGDAVGGFFGRLGSMVFTGSPADRDFDLAVEKYEKGELFSTVHVASRLATDAEPVFRDEANLLRGLSAASIDLREPAISGLERVLDADPPSPYYGVALAALLELEERFGNHRSAASAAARRLASFWARPESERQASIKAIFLEQGRLSPTGLPRRIRVEQLDVLGPDRRDRPVERAVYRAGLALLREKEFEKAATCFDAISEKSLYFPYARYALAQTSYALGDFEDAENLLAQVESFPAQSPGERFLRDRAALLLAQLAQELDDDSEALSWLARVRPDGPYAWHAALLAGEIRAREGDSAVALVYLKETPNAPAEPKILAQAVALDAELHRDLGDTKTAIDRLQRGIRTLDDYRASLQQTTEGGRLEDLRGELERREASRRTLEAWERANLALAIPDLVDWDGQPSWLSRWIASLTTDEQAQGVPVIYYPDAWDPFTSRLPPVEVEFDPPDHGAFPPAFRKSLGRSLSDVFARELALGRADRKSDLELVLLLLDGELRLAAIADGRARIDSDRATALGLAPAVVDVLDRNLAASEAMTVVLQLPSVDVGGAERSRLLELAEEQLERWRTVERNLLRQALADERTVVEELRYALDLELSQTLGDQRELERAALGGAPGS